MSHHKLGHAAQAHNFFVLAGRWSAKHEDIPAGNREELAAFHAEAAAVLGLEKSLPDSKLDNP
jgi:hypothetical protein